MHSKKKQNNVRQTRTSRRQFLIDTVTVGAAAASLSAFAHADAPDDGAGLRRSLAADPDRPTYHFVAPTRSVGTARIDSNGHYRLSYQCDSVARPGGEACWGHAISHDLVHWRDLPFTLYAAHRDSDRGARNEGVCFSWLPETLSIEAEKAQGWAGILSLPAVRPRNELEIEPATEIALLRRKHRGVSARTFSEEVTIPDIRGNALDIEAIIDPQDAAAFGIKVLSSPNGEEETVIEYRSKQRELTLDASDSSIDPSARMGAQTIPLELASGDPLKLRIFLDRSVIEVFANGVQRLIQRVYPSRSDSVDVRLFAEGARARLVSMDAWRMASIW